MTITHGFLLRASAVAAAVAGLIFIGVQINHPSLDATSITTTDVMIRNSLKLVMTALALAGITGVYLFQVTKIGVLGLLGYVVFAAGYLSMLGTEYVAALVLPSIAGSSTAYVTARDRGRHQSAHDRRHRLDARRHHVHRTHLHRSAASSSPSPSSAPTSSPAGPRRSSPSAPCRPSVPASFRSTSGCSPSRPASPWSASATPCGARSAHRPLCRSSTLSARTSTRSAVR